MDVDELRPAPALLDVGPTLQVSPCGSSGLVTAAVQGAHRFAVVGLFAGLAALGAAAVGRPFWLPLSICSGCGLLGGSAALLALSLVPRSMPVGREAVGVLVFTVTLTIVAMLFMLVARFDVLHADLQAGGSTARAAIVRFFTPPAELPPTP